jgi:hypothetical protein
LIERGERGLGCGLGRLLLAPPFRAPDCLAADEHLDIEAAPVRRAFFRDQPVRRQAPIVPLKPFLQR